MADDIRKLKCEEAIKLLLEYLDNELPHHDHSAMESHLNTCRGCFSRMQFERRLKGVVKDSAPATASDNLRKRIKKMTNLY